MLWKVRLWFSQSSRFCVVAVVGPGFWGSWAEAGSHCEVPGFRDHLLPVVGPDASWSVVAGTVESIGVWMRLEEPCFFLLEIEHCFLGSLEKDVRNSIVSSAHVSGTRAHGGMVAETSRTLPRKGYCVSCSRKVMRRWCCRAVRLRSASQSKRRSWVSPSARLLPRGFDAGTGRFDSLGSLLHEGVEGEGVTQPREEPLRVGSCDVVDGRSQERLRSDHVRVEGVTVSVPVFDA